MSLRIFVKAALLVGAVVFSTVAVAQQHDGLRTGIKTDAGAWARSHAFEIKQTSSNTNDWWYFGLAITPLGNETGNAFFEMSGFGHEAAKNWSPFIFLDMANGTPEHPTHVINGMQLGEIDFAGYGSTHYMDEDGMSMNIFVCEDFDDAHSAVRTEFYTTDIDTETTKLRMSIDCHGNLVLAPGMVMTNACGPFSGLPATPTAGMQACVNDSSVNTWGSNADGAGALTVLVWYDGSHWTVAGK